MHGRNAFDARGVETIKRLVEIVHAPVPHAGQRGLDAFAQRAVVLEETVLDVRLARHERAHG